MKRIAKILVSCLLAAGASTISFADAGLGEKVERFSRMYYAQMDGAVFSRLYDPSLGVVEFERKGGMSLHGAGGWRGRIGKKYVTIFPPANGGVQVEYVFDNGRPHILKSGNNAIKLDIEEGAVSYKGSIPEMWNEDTSSSASPLNKKWKGRWKGFYRNPNIAGALVSLLALTFVYVLFFPPSVRWRNLLLIAATAVAAFFCYLLFLTQSRGGMVALFAGIVILVLTRVWKFKGKLRTVLAVVLGLFVISGIAAAVFSGAFSAWLSDPGNALRIEIFKTVPKMMVDAPGGWRILGPGAAYTGWYQAVSSTNVTWTLVSSHLTELVALGWIGRFMWIFFWLLMLVVLFRHALKGGSALPGALWFTFFTSAVFNPVLRVWSLWVIPVASLALFVANGGLRHLRAYRVDAIVCAALSLVALLICWNIGQKPVASAGVEVRTDGDRLVVGGDSPQIWVVDDGVTFGWELTPKEIRYFYQNVKNVPPLGYVKSLSALPKKVGRLVLSGEQCRAYIDAWRRGTAPAAREVYFISPTFAPSEIPVKLGRSVSISVILGEFALRYVDVYGKPPWPGWVTVIPGAECYIPGWVSLAVGD